MRLWFEGALEDGKDFLKVKYDFSDVVQKISWLRAHDSRAEQIARRAKQKAEMLLSRAGMECYVMKLLNHYATLLV